MCAKKKNTGRSLLDFARSFYTDLEIDGMLHAVLVRSPISTGSIKSITHPAMPDGYFLFTAKDVPGSNIVRTLDTDSPVFADSEISYKGEPIGILAGPDASRLPLILEQLEIRFGQSAAPSEALAAPSETLAAPSETLAAPVPEPAVAAELAGDADVPADSPADESSGIGEQSDAESPVPDPFGGNAILAQRIVTGGAEDAELVFAESDTRIEGCYSAGIQPFVCTEPIGGIASYDGGMLTVYTPALWFSHLRQTVSDALGLGRERIVIKKTLTSGSGTNSIWYNAILMAQIAVASVLTGKPVKLVFSRSEQSEFIERVVPVAVNHRTAVSPDGVIESLIVSVAIDAGAYNPFISEILDRLVISAAGLYNPASFKIEAYAVRSRTSPASIYLPRADSQVFFAIETHLQQIARKIGMHPNELRLLNIKRPPVLPFRFNAEQTDAVFAAAARESDFARKYAAYSLSAGDPDLLGSGTVPGRGIGFVSAFEGSGFLGGALDSSNQLMKVSMEIDGTVTIHCFPPSASIRSIWVQIASKLLDVPPAVVKIDSDFSFDNEPSLPEGMFSNISVMTQLLRKCCNAIQKQRFRQPLPISVARGITRTQKKLWDAKNFCGTPFLNTALGAAAVEVELSPCTLRPNIRGIWIAIDSGEILAKKQAESTIKAAVRQVLSGLVSNDILDSPKISVSFIEDSAESKQIGSLVYSLIPAAYAAAVAQALGRPVYTLPLTTEQLYRTDSAAEPAVSDENESAEEESET